MTDDIHQPSNCTDYAIGARIMVDSDNTTALPFVTRRQLVAGGIIASTTLALGDIVLADDTLTPNTSPFASWQAVHSGLRVPNHDAAISWYTEKLDFRVVDTVSSSDDMTFVFLSPAVDDSFRLELLAGAGAAERPTYADLGAASSLPSRAQRRQGRCRVEAP